MQFYIPTLYISEILRKSTKDNIYCYSEKCTMFFITINYLVKKISVSHLIFLMTIIKFLTSRCLLTSVSNE